MKKENLSYLIAGFAIFTTMSMTIFDAQGDGRINGANGIVLAIPAKPTATVYVRGIDGMYKYLKKGYQVQAVEAGGGTSTDYHCFLMVKY